MRFRGVVSMKHKGKREQAQAQEASRPHWRSDTCERTEGEKSQPQTAERL